MRSLAALQRRLDAIALDQLRAIASAQAQEIDQLRERLWRAEEDANFWNREATELHLEMCELTGGSPGMTITGALVVVPNAEAAHA